jgi:hypothetical protein
MGPLAVVENASSRERTDRRASCIWLSYLSWDQLFRTIPYAVPSVTDGARLLSDREAAPLNAT